MTPEELLLEHLQRIGVDIHNGALPFIRRDIAAAVAAEKQRGDERVLAEREACAKVASDVVKAALTPPKNTDMARIASTIAAAIRARGNGRE